MYQVERAQRVTPWPLKIVIGVIGAACIALGLLGLMLPIIPGILFLALAVIVLSRISRRVDRWRREMPLMVRVQARIDALGRLTWSDRARACFWMALGGVIEGTRSIATVGGRLIARVGASRAG